MNHPFGSRLVRALDDTAAVAAEVTLTGADGAVLCRARVATSFWSRLRGLLGRRDVAEGEGLLFPRTGSVHTHFMRFPIDVVFLDDELRVVSVVPSLRPWRTASAKGAAATLEVAAGACARVGIAAGDALTQS